MNHWAIGVSLVCYHLARQLAGVLVMRSGRVPTLSLMRLIEADRHSSAGAHHLMELAHDMERYDSDVSAVAVEIATTWRAAFGGERGRRPESLESIARRRGQRADPRSGSNGALAGLARERCAGC